MDEVRKNLLEESYDRIINVGLCIVPYEDLSDIAAPELMFFGTTKDEKVFSFSELDAMFKSQYEQMAGFVNSLDRKRLFTRTSNDGNNAFITEEVTLTMTSPEEVNTIFMRCSCVMEYIDNQWKLTHLHASTPVDTENDHWHMEEWKREKEKLQKLVDQQTADLHGKNRELKIEAALERIRAQATAMQESSDLLDIVVTMRTEFVNLGHEAHYFWHMRWLPDTYEKAMTSGDGSRIGMVMTLPRHIHGDIEPVAEWEKSKEPTYVLAMAVDTAVDYVDKMISLSDFEQVDPQAPTLDDIRHIGGLTFIMARTTHGEIGFSLPGVVPDPPNDAVKTLVRFAGVFDLAYKRFEDLKAAERQHREAQIELALERVRAKSMAMHKSDELADLSLELVKQVQALGIDTWFCAFNIYDDHPQGSIEWGSNGQGTFPRYRTPREGVFLDYYEAGQRGETLLINEIGEDECPAHYDYLCSLPGVGEQLLKMKDEGIPFPSSQIDHVAFFKYGYIIFITFEPAPKAHDIFKRFTSVFDQTYTRFLDLKKSEQRTREAEVELSLERVRSQVTAMQESSDLFDIVVNMRKEFVSLGHTADYFWHMSWLPDSYEMSMTSEDGQRIGMVINLPKIVHEEIPGLIEWEKGTQPVYVLALNTDDAWDYIENMNTHGHYEQADPNAPTKEDIEHIGGLTFIMARTSHGEIGFSLPGQAPNPPKEALDTLVRFAGVFDLAYQRFEDLQESEQQTLLIREERDRLEIALKELEATQDQLIQQEKLASLGQLTAGIAHEIKNPLNFVNNFSELSVELIDEAREELLSEKAQSERAKVKGKKEKSPLEGGGDLSPDKSPGDVSHVDEALEILNDIETNLRKIHEHGSRADSIVKSMLEHSRGGTGKMEPTDLNALVREFVNLSFHGMRASKDPINVDMEFELDDSIGNVPLIAEDFSRVIINLCNNAFDAMKEKLNSKSQASNSKGYSPKLTIRTYNKNQATFLEIADNGAGISQEIKDKIFQPFFTTKKGTEGTGLGLSITNDIIKAHGGFLEVSTNQNEGTRLTIKLSTGG